MSDRNESTNFAAPVDGNGRLERVMGTAGPVKVKICGLTSVADAQRALDLGADWLGVIMAPSSPRYVTVQTALNMRQALPDDAKMVGVVQDLPLEQARWLYDELALECLQLHGRESAAYARALERPFVKAVGMHDRHTFERAQRDYSTAEAILLDSISEAGSGGTGSRFDWSLIPEVRDVPLILAGGLQPSNVADAIKCVHPTMVDVCSGVEASKGVKCAKRLGQFMAAVQSVSL